MGLAVVGLGKGFADLLKILPSVEGANGAVIVAFYVFPNMLGTPGKRGFGPSAVGFPKRDAPVLGAESVAAGFPKRLPGVLPNILEPLNRSPPILAGSSFLSSFLGSSFGAYCLSSTSFFSYFF